MLEEDLLFAYMSLRSLLFALVPVGRASVRAELYFHRRRESRGKVQYCDSERTCLMSFCQLKKQSHIKIAKCMRLRE